MPGNTPIQLSHEVDEYLGTLEREPPSMCPRRSRTERIQQRKIFEPGGPHRDCRFHHDISRAYTGASGSLGGSTRQ